jgi:hypothetical protein
MSWERMEWGRAIGLNILKVPLTKGDLGGSGFGGKQRLLVINDDYSQVNWLGQ